MEQERLLKRQAREILEKEKFGQGQPETHDILTPPIFNRLLREAQTVGFITWGRILGSLGGATLGYLSSPTALNAMIGLVGGYYVGRHIGWFLETRGSDKKP